MTRKSNKQILKRAGKDMARANKSVRIPLAPFTKRSTRPTLATRTTRSSVGDTKYFSIRSLNTRPKIGEVKQTGINSSLRGQTHIHTQSIKYTRHSSRHDSNFFWGISTTITKPQMGSVTILC